MHVLEIVFLMLREQVSTMHVIQYVCMYVCMYMTVGITTLVYSVHNASEVVRPYLSGPSISSICCLLSCGTIHQGWWNKGNDGL